MAALAVQCRFAGLQIEDDDYPPNDNSQKAKKSKSGTAKKLEPAKKNKNNNKPQSVPKKKKGKQFNPSSNQWELWKQKDEELANGNFETEMEQAILLSKLDYEENKDVYIQTKKDNAMAKKANDEVPARPGSKKQKKKMVMSLEQFNDMINSAEEHPKCNEESNGTSADDPTPPVRDTEFFDRIRDEAKNEILREEINERVRHRQISDEVITRVQYLETLEKKDKEISALRQEIVKLKQELLTVKGRNKKLCSILGQGEMKEKAEVLIEVEKLRAFQTELTSEIASLHTDLEKERSKNAQDPRSKDKKKKVAN